MNSKTIDDDKSQVILAERYISALQAVILTVCISSVSVEPVLAKLPVPHAVWISQGRAIKTITGNTLNINQLTDRAILNWKSFDVGEQNQVRFNQPSSSSVALNRIFDNKASEIMGRITANGQIYLFNRNGFLFGKNAIIDVNTLVTSTLNITEDAIEKNITGVFGIDQSAAFNGVDAEQYSYAVVDENGELVDPVIHDGRQVVIENNKLVAKGENNESLILGDASNLVDYEGNPVQVSADGRLIDYKGKPIVLDEKGQLVDYQWDFSPDTALDSEVKITLDSGARIRAADTGRIIMAAPKIENLGSIETGKSGQIILVAAKDKVYLQQVIDSDAGLGFNGVLVEMGTGGEVTNKGELLARLGNVTMAGFAVNQDGRVSATTSTNLNGSIRLIARESAGNQNSVSGKRLTGNKTVRDAFQDCSAEGNCSSVDFAENSITQILLDLESEAAVDQQVQNKSRVDVIAKKIHMYENSAIKLNSGVVNFTATESPNEFGASFGIDPVNPTVVENDSSIILENNSLIDVSGVANIVLPISRNILEVELRSGDALKDSPFQKGGLLDGKTVRVDARKGTEVFDIDPALAAIKKSIQERNTEGGVVNLLSQGDVNFKTGAKIDYSGGQITYSEGDTTTTSLVLNGSLINISDANPNLTYDAVVGEVVKKNLVTGSVREWNIDPIFANAGPEPGYVQGVNAGSLTISTNKLKLDGTLQANTVSGRLQRKAEDKPSGGRLNIFLDRFAATSDISETQKVVFSDTRIVQNSIADQVLQFNGNDFNRSGIQHVNISSKWADLKIDNGTAIQLPEHGSFKLAGRSIDMQGQLISKGGQVNLNTGLGAVFPFQDRNIILGENALIDTSGNWVNDSVSLNRLAPIILDGGKVTLEAQGDIDLASGSVIDVSGGAWNSEELVSGTAGEINLLARAPVAGPKAAGSNLNIKGKLRGYAVTGGGSLNVEANEILVSDDTAKQALESDDNSNTPLVLSGRFFSEGGFSSYSLNSNLNGVTFDSDLQLAPVLNNFVSTNGLIGKGSSGSLAAVTRVDRLPEFQRAPVSISASLSWTLGQKNTSAEIQVKNGANIVLEPRANFSLLSESSIFLDGSINAPSGEVLFRIAAPVADDPLFIGFDPTQSIWLGKNAKISTQGASRGIPNLLLNDGEVFDAGEVNLIADRGFIAAEAGAVINVSGTTRRVEKSRINPNNFNTEKTTVTLASNAGAINFTADTGIYSDALLLGNAAKNLGASGGDLSFKLSLLNRNYNRGPFLATPEKLYPEVPHVLQISNTNRVVHESLDRGQPIDESLQFKGLINEDVLNQGGFDSVNLASPDRLEFVNDISINSKRSVLLDAPIIAWRSDSGGTKDVGVININADYFALGPSERTSFDTARNDPASFGGGKLVVNADWIDLIGQSAFQGMGNVQLTSQKDIRLRGLGLEIKNGPEFADFQYQGGTNIQGDLGLTAKRIYNSTLTDFSFKVAANEEADITAKLSFTSNGLNNSPILAAGGSITANAPVIEQNGHLVSPQGTIRLNAEQELILGGGSSTTTALDGALVPFGTTEGGLEWLFPVQGSNRLVFDKIPEKKIVLNADKITINPNAKIDVSGGGDLLATEFVSGADGTIDFLDSSSSFAVLPGLNSLYAPYDPLFFDASGLTMGQSILLTTSTNGLAAGEYALLPARYALLPGAFLISPGEPVANLEPGRVLLRDDGAPLVAGRLKFAGQQNPADTKWNAFAVENNARVNRKGQYQKTLASTFFTNDQEGRRLARPDDAGQVSITAINNLKLQGSLIATGAGSGLNGLLDIASKRIAVLNEIRQVEDGVVAFTDQQIADFNVRSLLLGGSRQFSEDSDETNIDVVSEQVTIENNADLEFQEILLAATDQVRVQSGANISTSGAGNSVEEQLNIQGDGALLRVSSGTQAILNRTYQEDEPQGITGDLLIEEGARINSSGSLLLDSSRINQFQGALAMDGGSLNIGAQRINIGEVSENLQGMNLSNSLLNQLTVDELVLTSREAVNIYGALNVDLQGNGTRQTKLGFNAGGLLAFTAGDNVSSIKADTINFENSANIALGQADNVAGQLQLTTKTLTVGDGNFSINGYKKLDVIAEKQWLALGKNSTVAVVDPDTGENSTNKIVSGISTDASTVKITTDSVSGTDGSDFTLNAPNADVLVTSTGADQENTDRSRGLAVNFGINAASIDFNTLADLTAGQVNLRATAGDVGIGEQAYLNVAGAALNFREISKVAHGGKINLVADNGQVNFSQGSVLKLADNALIANSGSLNITAKNGIADISNTHIIAQSQGEGGRFSYDVDHLEGVTLESLGSQLNDSGVTGAIDITVRAEGAEGNLLLAEQAKLTANNIALQSEKGDVVIKGTLDASGKNAGTIELAAGDQIRLDNQAQLLANATDSQEGGRVNLYATDADKDGQHGVVIGNTTNIDVSSASQTQQGTVWSRVLRLDNNNDGAAESVAMSAVNEGVIKGGLLNIEAVKVYQDQDLLNPGVIAQADIAKIKTETDTFMENQLTIESSIGSGAKLLPGIEVQSVEENLQLASSWDFVDWRYQGAINSDAISQPNNPDYFASTGVLTLRSKGGLLINHDITDAFKPGEVPGKGAVSELLQPGDSWSYRLVSGAELSSANPLKLNQGVSNLVLSEKVKIRTGTGFINVAAAGNIKLNGNDKNSAAIYTIGRPLVTDEANNVSRYGSYEDQLNKYYAEYPIDGGDITLQASGNILAGASNQLFTDWFFKAGTFGSGELTKLGTAWGIAIDGTEQKAFHQGIGALGGGNIDINAGGNIENLSVVIPTVAKALGETEILGRNEISFKDNIFNIQGGGNLNLHTQGDLVGGNYYVGRGQARLVSDGSLKAARVTPELSLNPVLAISEGNIEVISRNDLNIETIFNPTILPGAAPQGRNPAKSSAFFTYSESASADLTSYAGDIFLHNNQAGLTNYFKDSGVVATVGQGNISPVFVIYPGSLFVSALSGNVNIENDFRLFPSPKANLEIVAKGDIKGTVLTASDSSGIVMSDADLGLLPMAETSQNPFPLTNLENFLRDSARLTEIKFLDPSSIALNNRDNNTPVSIISTSGNVEQLSLFLSKFARVYAGNDIRNVNLEIQNINSTDISIVEAGRDIEMLSRRSLSGQIINNIDKIEVSGPGSLQVLAGRNINLGASEGIATIGDNANPSLSDEGADLFVLAGRTEEFAKFDKFATEYETEILNFLVAVRDSSLAAVEQENEDRRQQILSEYEKASNALIRLVGTESISEDEKLELVRELRKPLVSAFFKELRDTGVVAASENSANFDRATKAIATLFPEQGSNSFSGDLNSFFSNIKTTDGGEINLLVPSGLINAGLAVDFSSIAGSGNTKIPGITAQGQGDVNIFASDDILVNQSRIFALDGGDITVFSSLGDIDAGRGAKSSLIIPPPTFRIDPSTNQIVIEFPPAVSGSGIRTASSSLGVTPGNVFLFAPQGVVDAGEAGIEGDRVTIAATEVLNADAIDFQSSIGVPTTQTSSVPVGLTATDNVAASVSKAAEESISNSDRLADSLAENELGTITVEVVGFGDCTESKKTGDCRES